MSALRPTLIASVVFTHPVFWSGLLAIGIPVVIHLLTRRTPRQLIFPTLQFLREAVARQSHWYRLRHPLLLMLRSLLILLLLLVFLKPVWQQGPRFSSRQAREGRTRMICLDTSVSMGYRATGITPLARAKAAALKILDDFQAGDRLNVIRMGVLPQACLDEPSDNLFFLRKDIQDTGVTQECAHVDAALALALQQLETRSRGRAQIFLVSDFQRTNWSAVDFSRVPPGVELFFVPTGLDHAGNAAVTEVILRPPFPTVAEPVEVICKLANYSDQSPRLPVQLRFRDGEVLNREVSLSARGSTTVSFLMRFKRSGSFEGEVTIPTDGLALDDRRCFTVNVAEQLDVLVVSDLPGPSASARFIKRAINPFAQSGRSTAAARQIRSTELDALAVSQAQIVILSEVSELPGPAHEVLMNYLREGGSVIFFHVGGADSLNLTRLAQASHGDFECPFKITGMIHGSGYQDYATWSQASFDHAILNKFRESADLAEIQFNRYCSTQRQGQKGQILLRYDDDNIAMAQATVGAGTLLLCNFSCGLQYSDMAKHPLFVPLVHEMIRALRPVQGGRHAFVVGEQGVTTLASMDQEPRWVFMSPSGEVLDGSIDRGPSGTAVFFPVVQECGFYRIMEQDRTLGSVAVNCDPLESNLETLDVSQVEALAQTAHDSSYAVNAGSTGLQQALAGKELWPYLLMAALIVAWAEHFFVAVCRH